MIIRAGSLKLDQLHRDLATVDSHHRYTGSQIESSCTGCTRIYCHAASQFEDELAVSMAVHYHVSVGIVLQQPFGLGSAKLMPVTHVEPNAAERMFE